MKKSGIYKIQSLVNPERIYIGSAVNLKTRKAVHFSLLNKGSHHSRKMQRHFNKYGRTDLVFSIIEPCFPAGLLTREQFYLDQLKPYFNTCQIAGNTFGNKHSKETRAKLSMARKGKKIGPRTIEARKNISDALKGRKFSEEHIAKLREVNKGNKHSLGHRHTEESKLKISLARKGKPGCKHTEEFKRLLGERRRGSKMSEEAKNKISLANKGNKYCLGRIVSEESRQKSRQSHLGIKKIA